MTKPADHPYRTRGTLKNKVATPKSNEEQRKQREVRRRIEDLKAQKEFDALWGE